jgi:hypothetical protein
MRKHLDKLRQQSIIEWKNADLKKAYEVGLRRSRPAPRRPSVARPFRPRARPGARAPNQHGRSFQRPAVDRSPEGLRLDAIAAMSR